MATATTSMRETKEQNKPDDHLEKAREAGAQAWDKAKEAVSSVGEMATETASAVGAKADI